MGEYSPDLFIFSVEPVTILVSLKHVVSKNLTILADI
jgi:hypothetical protein